MRRFPAPLLNWSIVKIPRSNIIGVTLLLVALAASAYLLNRSLALSAGAEGADVCSTVLGKSCDDTLTSDWSKLLGIPLAGWGVMHFVAMLLLLGRGAGRIFAGVGGLVSLGLLALLFFGDVPFCPLCVVANVLNLAAVVPVLRWERGGVLRPSAAAYGVTLVVTGALYAWMLSALVVVPPERSETVAKYEAGPVVEIPVSPEDPVLGPASAKADMIVFSDALCPHCKRFWAMLKDVAGGYGDDVRITFKHFPLDATCNPSVKETVHKNACIAGRALEAARDQGAFWEYDEALKAPAKPGRKKTFRSVAGDLGLDVERFAAHVAGEAGQKRMRTDIEIGMRLKLTATPAVFINGRRVRPPSPKVLQQVLDHVTNRRSNR